MSMKFFMRFLMLVCFLCGATSWIFGATLSDNLKNLRDQLQILSGRLESPAPKFVPLLKDSKTYHFTGDRSIEVGLGDITKMNVDAIVNAANQRLPSSPAGVAGAIWKVAGADELNKYIAENILADEKGIRVALGQAVITPGFKLPATYIIHTPGPDCGAGESIAEIYNCYKSSLLLADEKKLTSIAFPAISTGIFGCDIKQVAKLVVKAFNDTAGELKSVKNVYLVMSDSQGGEKYKAAIIREIEEELFD